MIVRISAALTALAIVLSSEPLAAFAQADSGQIVITVTDSSATKAPITLARVLLQGPVMTSEYSGANGAVKFTDVPDGIYQARVFKRGYQSVTSNQFEVSNGHLVSVAIVLAALSDLKEIGSVTVKSSATITTSSVSDSSAQRKLSGNLADALNKLSGVTVSTSSADSDATQTVSLQGQDPSQTSLTLDGVPLNAPGSAGNLGAMSPDLFRGASVSMGPQAGGLAGGVNFRTLEPTLAWQGTSSLSAGSYGKYNWSIGETGTLGKLGFAFQQTSRTTPSLAYGMVFKDASGLTYAHDATNQNNGDLLKLRMRIGNAQNLTATYLDSNVSNDLICLQVTGALPCGFGPGNSSGSHFQLYSLADSALIGETALQASIFQTSVKADRDLLNRFLNGIPDATGSLTDTTSKGFAINALLPARERHTIDIIASSVSTNTQVSPLIPRTSVYNSGSRTSSYSTLTLNDSIQSSIKLRLNERIGLSQSSNAPASLLAGVSASWTPTANDAYTASYSLGGAAAHAGPPGNFSDPYSLRFDCNGNIAYGNAPGDTPGASSSTDARLSWQHKIKAGIINTSLYRQVQMGVVLPTQVNGTAITGFPPGYFSAVQTAFDSPAGCNSPGAPFGAQNVYFSVPVGGVRRVYQGASIAASFNVGNLNVQPYYDITQAQAISSDPRINNPYSIVTSGGQLPNTPLHKAGLTLDYKAPGSAIESLLTAQYVGSNNSQNLPAYTTIDAGVDAHLKRGDLIFAANNIFNADGGVFATNVGAVPYIAQNGTLVPTIARPNAPRQFQVTFTMPFGASALTAPRATLASAVSGERGGPGARERGRFNLTPLPATPPSDPFTMTSSALCTPDAQKTIAPVLAQIKGYVAKIEASKTAAGYPDSVPGAPQIPGINVVYHKVGASYAVSTEVTRLSAAGVPSPTPSSAPGVRRTPPTGLAALPACIALHIAQPEDVQSRGLYAPPSGPFVRPAMQFMPSVGFYLPRQAPQAGQQSFRLYKLPTSVPSAPFALRATDSCTGEIKATAQRLLSELQNHFVSGRALQTWKVTPHGTSSAIWYELNNDDITAIPALLNCGHVAAASADEIKAAGFDGVRPPAVNYAPRLGLYIIRGNNQGQQLRTPDSAGQGAPPPGAPPPGAVILGPRGAPPPGKPPS